MQKRTIFWAGIFLAQIVLFYLITLVPGLRHIFLRLFELQKKSHQLLFSQIPFSVGDVFYIILVLLLLFFIVKLVTAKSKRRVVIQLLFLTNVLYGMYQIFWGLQYARKPIMTLLPETEITVEETRALAIKYLNLCVKTRAQAPEDANGVFYFKHNSVISEEILEQQKSLPDALLLGNRPTQVLSVKPSLFGGLMSFSGISGYYNPFTAEAQFDPALPKTALPFTLAHELAHQLGVAREQEASFVAYLCGKDAENIALRYSTQYTVLKSLLRALAEDEPQFVKNILQNYSPEMQRDRIAELAFRARHEGLLSDFFGFTNDLFLKSNRQEGSITYSYFVQLVVRHERAAKTP